MGRMAIISVDGHVRAARTDYRDYVEKKYLGAYEDWLRSQEATGMPDAGNLNPAIGVESQWDSERRLADLEGQGVMAEVLFPNGLPFQALRFEEAGRARDPELDRQAQLAYNRWLSDFCSQAPGRRAGQAVVSFDDVDRAVKDVYWAREHGLGGIMMPALHPGGTFFFDPALDPVWAACQEVGLPISQHGGSGAPAYGPQGFASILTLALEHSFYSGRSLWQMILGGVFDRFPDLTVVFVETEVDWIGARIRKLDRLLHMGDDWTGFARMIQKERLFQRTASEYWASNCYAGISPFSSQQISMEEIVGDGDAPGPFCLGSSRSMFGVDYPHFETIFPATRDGVAELVGHPRVTEADARKILYENAAEVYGFDLATLQPHMDRIGFEASDVLTPA